MAVTSSHQHPLVLGDPGILSYLVDEGLEPGIERHRILTVVGYVYEWYIPVVFSEAVAYRGNKGARHAGEGQYGCYSRDIPPGQSDSSTHCYWRVAVVELAYIGIAEVQHIVKGDILFMIGKVFNTAEEACGYDILPDALYLRFYDACGIVFPSRIAGIPVG